MHPNVYLRFERLIRRYSPPGPRILELGASLFPKDALLSAFQRLSPEFVCTGVNLSVPNGTTLPYRMVEGNANSMPQFADSSYDAVLCNALFEHDRNFWKTLSEVRRILCSGGLFYVGVPGFPMQNNVLQRAFGRLPRSRLKAVPGIARLAEAALLTSLASTRTLMFHAHPSDYYRFSEQAVREVFLEGLECLYLEYLLKPVRIIAVGRKP